MQLQTIIQPEKAGNPIDYQSKLLLLGSCFVENIGGKLAFYQFRHVLNPFGILFHPLAIQTLMERALNDEVYGEDDVFEGEGVWHCFGAHSALSSTSKTEVLNNLNKGLKATKAAIQEASHVILTLGTSWVYRHKDSGKIVANCHKVPQKEFNKELLSPENIQQSLEQIIDLIVSVNNKASVVFTISPVRHLKDGFVENQRSKSHLISAIHAVLSSRDVILSLSKERSRGLSYFPSYEIMMDELRDYRFYESDMVHPNALAITYIWEKFKGTWISQECYTVMDEVETVQKGLLHRPFNPSSEAHQKFEKSLEAKIAYLQKRYPFMNFRP